jgi:hypothetical protein
MKSKLGCICCRLDRYVFMALGFIISCFQRSFFRLNHFVNAQ